MFTSQHCTHSQFAYLCTLYQLKVRMPRWALSWAWTHGCPRDSITWHYMMGNVNPWDFSTPTKVVLMHHESENPERHPQFRNFKPTKSAIPIVWGLNNSLSDRSSIAECLTDSKACSGCARKLDALAKQHHYSLNIARRISMCHHILNHEHDRELHNSGMGAELTEWPYTTFTCF